MRVINEPNYEHVSYADYLGFVDNQYVKTTVDDHDATIGAMYSIQELDKAQQKEEEEEELHPESMEESKDHEGSIIETQGADRVEKSLKQLGVLMRKRRKVSPTKDAIQGYLDNSADARSCSLDELGKEITFDNGLSYNLVNQLLQEDAQMGQPSKYEGNCLAVVEGTNDETTVFFTDGSSRSISFVGITLEPCLSESMKGNVSLYRRPMLLSQDSD
jgi:hypothetical protein